MSIFFNLTKGINTMKAVIKVVVYAIIYFTLFSVTCFTLSPLLIGGVYGIFIVAGLIAILTFITTILIYNPLASLMPKTEDKKKSHVEYRTEIEKLQRENSILSNRVDTLNQVQHLNSQFIAQRALQVLTISKSGYIVKEEQLTSLQGNESINENFPKNWLNNTPDDWWVFYTGNKTYRYSIGIELEDIQYAIDTQARIIYFKNVKLSRIHRIHSHVDDNHINRVWIVEKNRNGEYKIINKDTHQVFKNNYENYQEEVTSSAIERAIDNMCKSYTEGMHNILRNRYNNKVYFVRENEVIEGVEWIKLTEGTLNTDISIFLNDLFLTVDTIKLSDLNYNTLHEALNPPLLPQIQSGAS